ncbi:MAG: hypothetical protein IKI08_00930 [Selenomonadaceae bacterium]|nr:hypothetical protein [Selenomonadaceae bacterium]
MKKQRISVSLPPDMMAHYKTIAEESGISVSRLIYLRLKSKKKSLVVVGQDMFNAVQELKSLVRQLLQGKPPSDEVVQSLVRYSSFLEKFVELDGDESEIVRGGGRRGD